MSDQQNKDKSNDVLWIGVLFAAAVAVIWYFFGTQITGYFLTLKLWEYKLVNAIFPTEYMIGIENAISQTPVKDWTSKGVIKAADIIGYVINIPLSLFLVFITYRRWKNSPVNKFKRKFTMKSLAKNEVHVWPHINPVLNVDLIKEPLDSGPFAMAYRPYDLSVKANLLSDPRNVSSLINHKAEKFFIEQLGKLWNGVNNLKPHEKALLLIFSAYACGNKNGAQKAFDALNYQAEHYKSTMDFSVTNDLMKHLEDPQIKKIISKHAYVYTVMASILEFAKSRGVVPTSSFIWLKPRDRKLFLVLNCVGRQTPFAEVAGTYGHWMAEKIAKHKLEVPYVENAIEGLKKALSEVKLEQED